MKITIRTIYIFCIGAAYVLAASFYLLYALRGWFWQDDFNFIIDYAGGIKFEELRDFTDFGRFISRNLYWFLGWHLFSGSAVFYFLFNFLLIIVSTSLIYDLLRQRFGRPAALLAGLFYFAQPMVIPAYTWLSNSQHLLAHLFFLAFLRAYVGRSFDQVFELSMPKTILLLLLFLLGLMSNIFSGLVLSLPLWFMLISRGARSDRRHLLLVIAAGLMFVLFIYKLQRLHSDSFAFESYIKRIQIQAYSISLDWGILQANIEFYFGSVWSCIVWLFVCLAGGVLSLRSGARITGWLFLASPLFLSMPFLFLVYQRYAQYAIPACTFFLLGLWTFILIQPNARRSHELVGITIILVLAVLDYDPMRQALKHPTGQNQHNFVDQVKALDATTGPDIQHYCFVPPRNSMMGWGIPADWWAVGFGDAFKIFVDPNKSYVLGKGSSVCDKTLTWN